MTPLPFTVIGGFLGAGKTTLVNHWLRHANGQRLAILVNDFGAINIDAALIESATDGTAGQMQLMELTNGCVCCQIGDDLSLALMRVLERADAFDAVIVEASGVSDPWRLAQLGRADPGLRLDGVVVVVDAGAVLQGARDPLLADTLERQVRAADLIVLNKCDSVDDLPPVREWIASVAGAVPQFETTQAAVPLAFMAGIAMPHADSCAGHDHEHGHAHHDHGAVFDTWSCRPQHAFDAEALRDWLRATPPGLLRLKGVVRTGTSSWSEIQFAGRRGTLRAAAQPDDGPAVVAIALRGRLPEFALVERFGN